MKRFTPLLALSLSISAHATNYGANLQCAGTYIETAYGVGVPLSGHNNALGLVRVQVGKNQNGEYFFLGTLHGQRRAYYPNTTMTEERMMVLSDATIAVTNMLYEEGAAAQVYCQLRDVLFSEVCAGQLGGEYGILASTLRQSCRQ